MKSTFTFFLIVLLSLPVAEVCAQVRVTGHVCAEVVEAADASYSGETRFMLAAENRTNVELGNIRIGGKPQSLCSFTLSQAVVRNIQGEEFSVHTISDNAQGFLTINEQGKRDLSLTVRADELPSGNQYSGSYNITFAYN